MPPIALAPSFDFIVRCCDVDTMACYFVCGEFVLVWSRFQSQVTFDFPETSYTANAHTTTEQQIQEQRSNNDIRVKPNKWYNLVIDIEKNETRRATQIRNQHCQITNCADLLRNRMIRYADLVRELCRNSSDLRMDLQECNSFLRLPRLTCKKSCYAHSAPRSCQMPFILSSH